MKGTTSMVAQTPVDLASLSVEDLKALRREWWETAVADGDVAAIARVVSELGTRHPKKHGANWIWRADDVEIVLDDWTGHTYARCGDRQVFAANATSKLFVPGPWMDGVRAAAVEAYAKIEARKASTAATERQQLLFQLGGAS